MVCEPSAAGCPNPGHDMEHPSFTWNPFLALKSSFQSSLRALRCIFDVCRSSQSVNFSFLDSLPLMFVQKSCFKPVLSCNTSRLWNIPFFSPDPAVSHRRGNDWLCGETGISSFPKPTDGLKIPLTEPLSTQQLVILEKKGVFEEIWSLLCHIITLQTEVLGFRVQLFLPPFLPSRKGGGVITNTIS